MKNLLDPSVYRDNAPWGDSIDTKLFPSITFGLDAKILILLESALPNSSLITKVCPEDNIEAEGSVRTSSDPNELLTPI